MKMAAKINPDWKWHNDTFNEGGEGYNPYPKYIASTSAVTSNAPSVSDNDDRKISIPGINRMMTISAVRRCIEKDTARLATLTDAFAIRITKEGIERMEKALEDNA